MTFYGLLFALLFLGACRDVLALWNDGAFTLLPLAILVAVLIFSDGINTSELETVDDKVRVRRKYKFEMKRIDLGSFVVLGLAVMLLAPAHNPFDVPTPQQLTAFAGKPWAIWALLTIYWPMQMRWNWHAGTFSGHIRTGAYVLLGLFAVMVPLGAWAGALPCLTGGIVVLAFIYGFILDDPRLAAKPPGPGHRP